MSFNTQYLPEYELEPENLESHVKYLAEHATGCANQLFKTMGGGSEYGRDLSGTPLHEGLAISYGCLYCIAQGP
eukprot:UN17699